MYERLKYFTASFLIFITISLVLIPAVCSGATQTVAATPFITIGFNNNNSNDDSEKLSVAMQLFLLLTVLSIAPAILIMLTSFTRIVIVLSLLRQAIGTHQMPPNQIVIGLSLFITFFIMSPVWDNVNEKALKPYLEKKITQEQAIENAFKPVRKFMFKQTREKDLALLVNMAKLKRPANIEDIPTRVLIPSFIISELKTAFQIGFLLYVPFLIVDMVVASILLSMGMMMLPPVMISLPFKLMLFVMADGWYLIVGSLVKSFA